MGKCRHLGRLVPVGLQLHEQPLELQHELHDRDRLCKRAFQHIFTVESADESRDWHTWSCKTFALRLFFAPEGVARSYDLGIACLSDLMLKLVFDTHVDIVMPISTLLMSAVCLFLANKVHERRDNRSKLSSHDIFLMIAVDLAMNLINWLSLPVLFLRCAAAHLHLAAAPLH